MATPPVQPPRRSSGDSKKTTPPSSIVTRNSARNAKIQTRAMSAGAKPSASLLAAKKKAQQKKKHSGDTILRDHYQIAMDSKTQVRGPTGLVLEPRMLEHRCLWDNTYPECPERLSSIIERCTELGLIERCKILPPRMATKEELLALHSPSVYDMMETTHNNEDLAYLEDLSSKYDAIYIHPSTHELALTAAGSTIDLVEAVVRGTVQNGMALVRPPGHHAMRAEPCGYCFYNNVALAAAHARDKLGVERILIVDWDVHHGQATQQMFYDDPRVVYFSIHRYEHGAFWPNLRQSNFNYTGNGAGRGYNFNVPLNATGMTDADYLAIFHQLLLPMAFEYQPQLIIVSAGYDAAIGCPEGEMSVSPACFASLTSALCGVCPALCGVLEGGYCLPALADSAALTLRTLLGHPPPAMSTPATEPCDEIRATILNCIYAHKRHWRCFNYQPTYSADTSVLNLDDRAREKHVVAVKWEGDETRAERFATRDCYPVQDDRTKELLRQKLENLSLTTDLSIPQYAVSYAYDVTMLKHKNICEPGHVECPERIMRIHERLRDYDVLSRLHLLPPSIATDEQILACHSTEHLNRLKELSSRKLRELNSQKEQFDSVYLHPDSLDSARAAAGAAIQAVDSVLNGESGSAVCCIRPPGHHAHSNVPSGFCLLNNVAIAAHHAVCSRGVSKVLIVDWDVHHGDGTQSLTYDTDQILYISIHRYDHGSFFPHSVKADHTHVGEGKGLGYNVNIPWNKRGMGDTEYLAAFSQVVLPVAHEFRPDLVLVSAGFDACVGDPLGGCKVSPECYGRMTSLLRGLARGRLVLCLEGGYNVTSTSYAMTMCTKALLGDPIHTHYEPKPVPHWSAVETINEVISVQKKYWKSLKFQVALPMEDVLPPQAPSRGLILTDDVNSTYETDKMSELSLSTTLDDSSKSIDKSKSVLDGSLENGMSNLSLHRPKCADGLHCGTDDEEEEEDKVKPGPSKSNSQPVAGSSRQSGAASSTKKEEGNRTFTEYMSENRDALVNEEMFAVVPLPWCPHLELLPALPPNFRFEQGLKCIDCGHRGENWVCLHCFVTACARYVHGHMQYHYHTTGHALSLSLTDLSVWCSACESYVDNNVLYAARNNAHRCKFNEDMPWCYTEIEISIVLR